MSYAGSEYSLTSTRTARTNSGTSTVRVYEGTYDGITSVISALTIWDQWDVDDSAAPLYRLTVRTPDAVDGGTTSIEYAWEIVGSELQRDLKEHSRTLWATSEDTGENDLRAIEEAIKNPTPGTSPAITTPDPKGTYLEELYKLMLKGTSHWLWPHYNLRFSATVGPTFTGGIVDDGAMRIWSADQIISYFSNFPMYERTQARVEALQTQDPSTIFGVELETVEGYTWGWLKKPMTETMQPDFKIKLQTEWELELWNTYYIYTLWT